MIAVTDRFAAAAFLAFLSFRARLSTSSASSSLSIGSTVQLDIRRDLAVFKNSLRETPTGNAITSAVCNVMVVLAGLAFQRPRISRGSRGLKTCQ
ncbi:MAG: hypothetical protein WBD49_25775 [Bradyrhizobium sp.]